MAYDSSEIMHLLPARGEVWLQIYQNHKEIRYVKQVLIVACELASIKPLSKQMDHLVHLSAYQLVFLLPTCGIEMFFDHFGHSLPLLSREKPCVVVAETTLHVETQASHFFVYDFPVSFHGIKHAIYQGWVGCGERLAKKLDGSNPI